MAVEKKLEGLLKMTEKEDFGDLTGELEVLNNLIMNMQKGILEPLLESLETIERRMNAYSRAMNENSDNYEEFYQSEPELDFSQSNFEEENGEEGADEEVGTTEAELQQNPEPFPFDDIDDSDITVKQKRFFERLEHFFDFQAIAEERVAVVDPQGKIEAMRVKSHSRGIQEKDGTFKAGYRQQNLQGEPVRHLGELYDAAEEALPSFKTTINSLVDSVHGLTDSDCTITEMKERARAAEKAREQYAYRDPGPSEAWLYDVLRASIYCKSYKQMSEINKWLKENVHIVECENRFAIPQFDGYRDILYYISVPYKGELAFICEIQVHHKEFKRYFGKNTHLVFFRQYFAGPWREPVENLQDLEMLLQVGRVDDNLMEHLLDTTDSNQLKLFGRIFYEKLEETDKSLELFKRVLTMEESSLGRGHIMTGSTYEYLGLILLKKGDYDGSLLYLREALTVFKINLGSEHPEYATIHKHIGEALSAKGDFTAALKEYRTCLEIREEALGEDHLLVAESYLKVAQAYCDKGDFKQGMAECRTALIIQESMLGKNHVALAEAHTLAGDIMVQQGEFDNAIESYKQALTIREDQLGKKHQKVANSLTNIGIVKLKQNLYDEAETFHRKALQIRELSLGKDHPDNAISYSNLGLVLGKKGDYDGAITVLRLSLKIITKAFGRAHLFTSSCYSDVGMLLSEKGDLDNALNQYKECLAIRKSLFGRNHPLTAEAMNSVGRIKTKKEDHASAKADHEKALSILEKLVGAKHPKVANTYQYIAEMYQSASNPTKALESHSKALGIRTAVLGKHHPDTAASCVAIAELLKDKGDFPGAKMAYRQALTASLRLRGECNADTAVLRIKLGRVLMIATQELDAAEEEFRHAMIAREELFGNEDLLTAESYCHLGSVLNRKSEFEEALKFHQMALEIRQEQLEDDHPEVVESVSFVGAAKTSQQEEAIAF